MADTGQRRTTSTCGHRVCQSKVLVHWYARAIHFEEKGIIALPVDPGSVQSALGNYGAKEFGYEKTSVTTEEGVPGLISVIDDTTRETHSGKLWQNDGKELAW
ncbi:hypothetical protein DL769_009307 [Monosporascus sp. CRB-8-3]|nr:hypothetical protein DL769_009307 [Monosporascus sp. CRB-8-3]